MAQPGTPATNQGNFFEDFTLGREIAHPSPRTLTSGDAALYGALYGSRFQPQLSAEFARAVGYGGTPLDDILVFNVVFGQTVADVSLNAVANLGYAEGVFGVPVHAGDTLRAHSTVIGLKETSQGKTGIVHVRSTGLNQQGEAVIEYVRWVMVKKRDPASPAPEAGDPPTPAPAVAPGRLVAPAGFRAAGFDTALSGSRRLWDDYGVGERIDHVDGITVEEADHMTATRLYRNPARVHFNQHQEKDGRFGRRIVYGGHVIAQARALSFNGLANAWRVAAINAGRHVAPTFAGDTLYAWSEITATAEVSADVGALRLTTIALKDRTATGFPGKSGDDYEDAVVLDLDTWVLMPRRG